MTSPWHSALGRLTERLDALRAADGSPLPWCLTRSYCAPELGYCIWVGHVPFFRPTLGAAIAAASQHVRERVAARNTSPLLGGPHETHTPHPAR